MYNEQTGLMYKKWADAINLVDKLKEKEFVYKDSKGNVIEIPDSIKDKVRLSSEKIYMDKVRQVANYQVQEGQKYSQQLAEANINNIINNNITKAFNKDSFKDIDNVIYDTYSNLGKDIIEYKQKQVRDNYTKQRIAMLLEISDNETAKTDLDTVKDKITQQTYEDLSKAIRGTKIADCARDIFAELEKDSVDINGYIKEETISGKIDNIKKEKFTDEEKEKIKNLLINKSNFKRHENDKEKARRNNEFQNDVATMYLEDGHKMEEFEKVAVRYARTPLEKQANLKYVHDLFKKESTNDPYVAMYLWDSFENNTIKRTEIEEAYINGSLSQSTYTSMLKRYDKDTLSSNSDDYARWKEINARIKDIADKHKSNKYSKTEIENELINSIQKMDYVEANKELDRITKNQFFGKPIYKKEIINRRELDQLQSVIDQDFKISGIDKSKLVNLLQEGIGDSGKVNLDYMQQFIRNNIVLGNLRNPNNLEVRVLRDLISAYTRYF